MPLPCHLDHIVIAARDLAEGVAWFQQLTGIAMPPGGAHPLMSTHNHLMQVGDNAFLEIIAINNQATPPQRPRWYGLDDELMRGALQQPRLITWVANTNNLSELLGQTDCHFGDALEVTRDNLRWHLTVAADGSMPDGGLLPSLIEWDAPGTPCAKMPDLGCRLQEITVYHRYPHWYTEQLKSVCCDHLVEVKPVEQGNRARIVMQLSTPNGLITINSL